MTSCKACKTYEMAWLRAHSRRVAAVHYRQQPARYFCGVWRFSVGGDLLANQKDKEKARPRLYECISASTLLSLIRSTSTERNRPEALQSTGGTTAKPGDGIMGHKKNPPTGST